MPVSQLMGLTEINTDIQLSVMNIVCAAVVLEMTFHSHHRLPLYARKGRVSRFSWLHSVTSTFYRQLLDLPTLCFIEKMSLVGAPIAQLVEQVPVYRGCVLATVDTIPPCGPLLHVFPSLSPISCPIL